MVKFVVILTTAITFNFTLSFGEILGISEKEIQEVKLVFSEEPIAYESGQPVYPIQMEVYVQNPEKKTVSISVNGGQEIIDSNEKIDLSDYLKPHGNTYTVAVQLPDNNQEVFGFTTK